MAASKILWATPQSFSSLTPEIFRTLFMTHIRPILEYGKPAFYPATKRECVLLEGVQRKGSKVVAGLYNTNYEERLKHLGLFSLEYRRHRGALIDTWKILNDELGEEIRRFFVAATNRITRGHPLKLCKPRRLRHDLNLTLSTRIVNAWNKIR